MDLKNKSNRWGTNWIDWILVYNKKWILLLLEKTVNLNADKKFITTVYLLVLYMTVRTKSSSRWQSNEINLAFTLPLWTNKIKVLCGSKRFVSRVTERGVPIVYQLLPPWNSLHSQEIVERLVEIIFTFKHKVNATFPFSMGRRISQYCLFISMVS